MNKGILGLFLRFIVLLLIQLILFKSINLGIEGLPYFTIFVYPIFILILPIHLAKELVLLLAFAMGIIVDAWYLSPGVHASALVFAAFIRPYLLVMIPDEAEIRTNYGKNILKMKLTSYVSYASIFIFVHALSYFLLDSFAIDTFGISIIKAFFSSIFSFIFAFIYILITGYS